MSTAPKYEPHYTVDDYLQWDGDWELWNGIPISMSPAPSPRHQSIASQLIRLLGNQLDTQAHCGCCQAIMETDWKVSDDTVVRPDVMITCDPLPEKHILKAPVLIAEVLSPSTANKDLTVKRELYESQGVKYYLTIDPETQHCNVLQLKSDKRYQSALAEKESPLDQSTCRLELLEDCIVELDANSLF